MAKRLVIHGFAGNIHVFQVLFYIQMRVWLPCGGIHKKVDLILRMTQEGIWIKVGMIEGNDKMPRYVYYLGVDVLQIAQHLIDDSIGD